MASKTQSNPEKKFSDTPYEIENCRGVLQIFSNGSIVRSPQPSFQIPVEDDGSVLWKDVGFDKALDLHLRVYKPLSHENNRLPIFYYFHGGGYCIGSRTWPNFHNFCLKLSRELPAIVIAPDYRLAPENRLPSAIDDAFSAVRWLATDGITDQFLSQTADFGRVYISGDSAGGNIAHHLAVGLSEGGHENLTIKGFVLLMPFFGGVEHTLSEATCPQDAFLKLDLNDRYWRLSLPEGTDRDHPLSNPFGPGAKDLGSVDFIPMLDVVGERDLLRDRGVEYGKRLVEMGKKVEVVELKGQQHGFFTIYPNSQEAKELMDRIRAFIEANA
ncbi:probable carboxylesterase 15 [Amborella trichopoda]|uniref:Alpha/beta hydrolase fold-3 domain-containing protein n=1 Tax=Amborella trichopoda TaxID=13333 RepID=W1NE33_AMBTC|nr:probable carboxylesterase 15 [Amborella trichopoda]ERM93628.1 hypothetical protein AMTR_s00004p00146330 [Amborella trichopoda]|eukprot:XP_006826391.1 probable carboxylesterase 15 [Amborella trichopoda]